MNSKALFTLCRIALASTRTLYRVEFLFTHKNGDLGTIFVREQSYAAPKATWGSYLGPGYQNVNHNNIKQFVTKLTLEKSKCGSYCPANP